MNSAVTTCSPLLRTYDVSHQYNTVTRGYAAKLNEEQLAAVRSNPNVAYVYRIFVARKFFAASLDFSPLLVRILEVSDWKFLELSSTFWNFLELSSGTFHQNFRNSSNFSDLSPLTFPSPPQPPSRNNSSIT